MSLYYTTEQVMNGTATMTVKVSGIRAHSFHEAAKILLKLVQKAGGTGKIEEALDNRPDNLTYLIPGEFPCIGKMEDQPLIVLNDGYPVH